MSKARIKALYESRLKTWAEAHDLPVQMENESFTAPASERPEDNIYLQCFILPAQTTSDDLAGNHTAYRGVCQINVVIPKGLGSGHASPIVTELTNLFTANLRLEDVSGFAVQQLGPLSEAPGLGGETTYLVPTSFSYRADVL